MRLASVVFAVALAAAGYAQDAKPPLLFETTFDKGTDAFQPTDANAWKIVDLEGNKVYNQFKLSKYTPPTRSPHNVSLVKDILVSDFVLTCRVQSTSKAGNHRDMCLFFNYQDPRHFYYVHLGKVADPNSCQIMIVNDAPRTPITKKAAKGTPWDEKWHDVKIVRKVDSGSIEIYFDDMKEPLLTAEDKTFTWGQVGIGSFDDSGYWDDLKLWGTKVAKPK